MAHALQLHTKITGLVAWTRTLWVMNRCVVQVVVLSLHPLTCCVLVLSDISLTCSLLWLWRHGEASFVEPFCPNAWKRQNLSPHNSYEVVILWIRILCNTLQTRNDELHEVGTGCVYLSGTSVKMHWHINWHWHIELDFYLIPHPIRTSALRPH